MRKVFVSVMCLLMLLTGCANELDVKMSDGALPAAQMDVDQAESSKLTDTSGTKTVDISDAGSDGEIKGEVLPESSKAAVSQPSQESNVDTTPAAQVPKVESIAVVDNAKPNVVCNENPAETVIPAVVDSAKTDIPTIIGSAKTDPQASVANGSPATSQPAVKTTDLDEVMAVANAYAANEYGVAVDTKLGFQNSAYRFPAYISAAAPQSNVEAKARDIVDYTFQQLMTVNHKTLEDVCNAGFVGNLYAYVEAESIVIYFFYN